MTFYLKKKLLCKKVLSSALLTVAVATTGFGASVRAEDITPAQWIARQPKPVFKPGHTMPRLTRFGWDLNVDTFRELAGDWNYVVQTNYVTDQTVATLDDPNNP